VRRNRLQALYLVGSAIRFLAPPPSGSGSRGANIHTSCAVVSAPTFVRAFARWCLTVECDRPRRWAAAFSDPGASPMREDRLHADHVALPGPARLRVPRALVAAVAVLRGEAPRAPRAWLEVAAVGYLFARLRVEPA
jgi:hypothetical protein